MSFMKQFEWRWSPTSKPQLALLNRLHPQNDNINRNIPMRKLPLAILFVAITSGVLGTFQQRLLAQEKSLPDRPDTQRLLPETTVGLVKLRNFREYVEKTKDSGVGKLLQSDSVKPLVEGIYESAAKQYENVEQQVGLSLEEVQSIPSGEITIAMIAPRRKDMQFVVILETDEENDSVNVMIDRGKSALEAMSGEKTEGEENEFKIEIETVIISGNPAYFANYKGLLLGSTSKDELNDIFTRWSGQEVKKVRSLDKNRKFITVSKRCAVSSGDLPDVRFFADPIGILKSVSRGEVGMNFVVALLPTLGVDGVLAVGGNLYIGHGDYEALIHGHLMLASPKEGLLNALALKPNDYTPQPWVPTEIANYFSTSWDVPQMLASSKDISDKIAPGSFDWFLEDLQKELEKRDLGIDIRTDLIDQLSGSLTFARPVISGTEVSRIGNIASWGIRDAETFAETLETLMDANAFSDAWQQKEHGDIKFWGVSEEAVNRGEERKNRERGERKENAPEREQDVDSGTFNIRIDNQSLGIIGDQLVLSDSVESFKFAVDTFNGKQIPLADDKEFQEHVDTMTKLLKTELPAAVFYFDSPREVGAYLKMLEEGNFTEVLAAMAEDNESVFLGDVKAAIDDNGFPKIEDVEDFLSTSGGFITTDDSGYHLLFFQERAGEQ